MMPSTLLIMVGSYNYWSITVKPGFSISMKTPPSSIILRHHTRSNSISFVKCSIHSTAKWWNPCGLHSLMVRWRLTTRLIKYPTRITNQSSGEIELSRAGASRAPSWLPSNEKDQKYGKNDMFLQLN